MLAREQMRCAYCGCPTAAELEHIKPRAEGGLTTLENIVLSCPLCNRRKSTRPADEFLRSKDWRLLPPDDLEISVEEMMRSRFCWDGGDLRTGSAHARVRIEEDEVLLMVRPGKRYDWKLFRLGQKNDPALVLPTWDFLTRHITPEA